MKWTIISIAILAAIVGGVYYFFIRPIVNIGAPAGASTSAPTASTDVANVFTGVTNTFGAYIGEMVAPLNGGASLAKTSSPLTDKQTPLADNEVPPLVGTALPAITSASQTKAVAGMDKTQIVAAVVVDPINSTAIKNDPNFATAEVAAINRSDPSLVYAATLLDPSMPTPASDGTLPCGQGGSCGEQQAAIMPAIAASGGHYDWTGLWIPYGSAETPYSWPMVVPAHPIYRGGPLNGQVKA